MWFNLTRHRTTRREALRDSARWVLLGVLTTGAAWVGSARRSTRPGASCINQGACGQCAILTRCGLPPARKMKRNPPGGLP